MDHWHTSFQICSIVLKTSKQRWQPIQIGMAPKLNGLQSSEGSNQKKRKCSSFPFKTPSHIFIPEEGEDRVWMASHDGLFSVASFFSTLAESSVAFTPFSRLWRLKTPPRVLAFMWLALRGRILTIYNLHCRNRVLVNACTHVSGRRGNSRSSPLVLQNLSNALELSPRLVSLHVGSPPIHLRA